MGSIAYSTIRHNPWYRREAFAAGLRAAGYEVRETWPSAVRRGDVLLIWNRYADRHDKACKFEREGGTVVVAENGYLGRGGSAPKFDVHPNGPQSHHYYAVALHGHNGQGKWPTGDMGRFLGLEVPLVPLVERKGYVLVCPNRSFGVPGRIMPADWAEKKLLELKQQGREARIRRHPGNDAPKRPLAEDLAGAEEVHIWSSGAGIHALVAGIPVVCHAPYWICKSASQPRAEIKDSWQWADARVKALMRMAWAQWTLEEIERGDPFIMLLGGRE